MKKTFKIGDLFRASWTDYKTHWKQLILVGVIVALVSLLGNIGSNYDAVTGAVTQSPIIGILGWLLQMFVGLGLIKYLLNLVDKKEAKIEDLFRGAQSFEHYAFFVVVAMLYGALIGLGTILLIIPGMIAMVGFIFAQYLIAEGKAGIFESFKESWELTKGNRWKIFWLMIVLMFFNLFGAVVLLVGLVITIPVSYIILARLYRTLSHHGYVSSEENDMEVIEVMEGNQTEE